MKTYLNFAWKVAVALIVINAVTGVVSRFVSAPLGATLRGFINNPLALLDSTDTTQG